ncbi:MAG TPA: hypothetical protein VMZ28_00280 [Kofleriaceae bacterium]|nr:hypothetical protein [Kofleriaceae bacterium]
MGPRMTQVLLWGLAGLGGCGRAGFDAHVAAGDATPEVIDAGSPDAASGPFGDAVLVEEVMAIGLDDDPSLTGDLREMYFKSDRGGGADIWVVRRDSAEDDWGDPEPVDELNSPQGDDTPEVSLDGLTITLASDRDGAPGGIDLFVATRLAREDDWGLPQPIVDLNTNDAEYAAVMDAAGEHVVFNRDVPGNALDLFGAVRDGAGWTAPAQLVNLSTAAYEADSHLSDDALELYFTAELADAEAHDIYRVERAAPDGDFGTPERVVELASPQADEDPWVSPDGRVIYFSSERSGNREIYRAER